MKHIRIEQTASRTSSTFYTVANKRGEDLGYIRTGLTWCDGAERIIISYCIKKSGQIHARDFSDLNEAVDFFDRNAYRFGFDC